MTYNLLKKAKKSVKHLGLLSAEDKNKALISMANQLIVDKEFILKENFKDVESATHLSSVILDRLTLTGERIEGIANGIRDIAKLPDPTHRVLETFKHENGLEIDKVSVPFGVVAVIFESRPNVSADTAALCLKSGNVCVLRCGKDSFLSCNAIVNSLKKGLKNVGLDESFINLVQDKSRESAKILMTANEYVDLLIPRGGKSLISECVNNATVQVIETGTGICHVYVDDSANLDMAIDIVNNAKTSRPSVCNAEEVLLVNKKIAGEFLPKLKHKLVEGRIIEGKKPVELRLDAEAIKIIDGTLASEEDFSTEFLDYILAVKIVDGIDEAIDHIEAHSTHHSDAIISSTEENIERFINCIDSAAVYVNASTRFTDGGEFGKGAEIGISTQKLHARGPMGLSELNTYKYVVKGKGQTRG